jgi:hypothetical protein
MLHQDPEQLQIQKQKDILLVKIYNTQHHLQVARFHGNVERDCTMGKKAKSYLSMFESMIPSLLAMQPEVRFEVRSRLPMTVTNDSSESDVFQHLLDTIIAVWKEAEWIHLPVPHVTRSMQRVIDFATSIHIPAKLRCFDIRASEKLMKDAREFAATVFQNLGFGSVRSNALFAQTYSTQEELLPRPLDWFVYYVWVHHFETKDPNADIGQSRYSLYLSDQYLRMRNSTLFIEPTRLPEENMRIGLTYPEWHNQIVLSDEFVHFDYHLFGNYVIDLNSDNSTALFGDHEHLPWRVFIHRTRNKIPLSQEEGGYVDENEQDIPNDPDGPGYRGGYQQQLDVIIKTVKMTTQHNGQFVARFRNGGIAAVGNTRDIVAEKIIEYMKHENPNSENYKDWKTNMILNEPDDESESIDTATSNASEMAEIKRRVKFHPQRNGKFRTTYVSRRGRGPTGSKKDIIEQIIEDGVDWRNTLVLNSDNEGDTSDINEED